MEEEKKMKMKMNTNGETMKLPIGFRFRPTDEELVVHYLRRKALSLPLPASVIPDHLHLFHSDPYSLPGNLREKRYYFLKRKGNKCSRIMATSSGFWKAVGKGKKVISSAFKNDVVGSRKSWAFYQISNNHLNGLTHCSKTPWFMHEFQLLQNQQVEDDEWVVCRIFQRKMRLKNKIEGISEKIIMNGNEIPSFIDFRVKDGNTFELGPPQPQPSSPFSNSDSC